MTACRPAELRVVPVTDAPWDDVRTVFGTRGDPARCWCQYFKVDAATWKAQDVAAFERALCDQTEQARASHGAGPGVLAYDGDEPVGWCAVEQRTAYRRILNSQAGRPRVRTISTPTTSGSCRASWCGSGTAARVSRRRCSTERWRTRARMVHG